MFNNECCFIFLHSIYIVKNSFSFNSRKGYALSPKKGVLRLAAALAMTFDHIVSAVYDCIDPLTIHDELCSEEMETVKTRGQMSTIFQKIRSLTSSEIKYATLRLTAPDRHIFLKKTVDEREAEIAFHLGQEEIGPHVYCVIKKQRSNFFIVSEQYEKDLMQVAMEGRVSPEDKLTLCASFVDKLAKLHGLGIAHGDIKPENAVCSLKSKSVMLIDCTGIGRVAPHTPNYLSPERGAALLEGRSLSLIEQQADDVYAAAVAVFCILAETPLLPHDRELYSEKGFLHQLCAVRHDTATMGEYVRTWITGRSHLPSSTLEKVVCIVQGVLTVPLKERPRAVDFATSMHGAVFG